MHLITSLKESAFGLLDTRPQGNNASFDLRISKHYSRYTERGVGVGSVQETQDRHNAILDRFSFTVLSEELMILDMPDLHTAQDQATAEARRDGR